MELSIWEEYLLEILFIYDHMTLHISEILVKLSRIKV